MGALVIEPLITSRGLARIRTPHLKTYALRASQFMPRKYLQLVFAALLGYALYGEAPDQSTGTGAMLIVGSAPWVTVGKLPPRIRPVGVNDG